MVAASLLAAFWAAFVLALVSPGPNFAVLLGTALQRGRAAAVKVAFGMAIGEAVWGFAAVFGVALLAARHPWIGTGLRVGGGMFLLYLAFLSIRAALRRTGPDAEPAGEPAPSPAARGGIARGFGLMLLNPKAGVFWVSLTSVFLTPETPASIGVIAVAGAVLLSLGWHTMLAVALSADAVTAAYRRLRRGLEATLGVVLAGLGLRLLVSN
ncbi:LysE family transporter [Skermanella rosea]|uniref:LysE family transporter n=1 Tax=Skermanella rosea TaxID=1817965 RepID=UPI0019349150|nr:LysE family transporter [Skermanella rosea]UEM03712.1 LysE family transporter [Skermanella rosea]